MGQLGKALEVCGEYKQLKVIQHKWRD